MKFLFWLINFVLPLFLTKLFAQGYYDLRLPEDQIAHTASTLPFSKVVLAGTNGNLISKELNGWLAVLNYDGSLVSQFSYEIEGQSIQFKHIEIGSNSVATIAAEITDLSTYRTRVAIITISLYQPESPAFLQMQYYGDSTDHIQLKGMYLNPINGQAILYGTDIATTDAFILSSNQRYLFGGPGLQVLCSLQPSPSGPWLALISEYEPNALSSAVYLDQNFQALYSQALPNGVYEPKDLNWKEDSLWYCTGAKQFCLDAPSGLRPRDIVLIQGKTDSLPIILNCLGTVNQNDLPGGTSFNYEQTELLLSWTPAYRIFVPQSQGYGRNSIPVSRTDTSGNIISSIEVGETAYYEIHQVTQPRSSFSTKTWLITGSRYDIYNASTGTDAFVIIYPESFPLSELKYAKEDETFSIFPNPVSEQDKIITLSINKMKESEIEIINTNGEILLKTQTDSQVHLPNLTAGIYWVRIYSDGMYQSKKLVVSK
jgi:hypothetical protein